MAFRVEGNGNIVALALANDTLGYDDTNRHITTTLSDGTKIGYVRDVTDRKEMWMKRVHGSFRGKTSLHASLALLAVVIYTLAFASLFITLPNGGYGVVNVALPTIFLSAIATIVFASVGGRKGGLGRTTGVLSGVILILLPVIAVVVAKT